MKRILAIAPVMLLAALAPACEKSDVVATEGSTIILTADPTTVTLGNDCDPSDPASPKGHSTITATVYDNKGAPQQGVGLIFSTDSGEMRSHGSRVKTSSSGVAQDTLLACSDATVTVRSGQKSADIEITVGGRNQPPRAIFDVTPNPQKTNQNLVFDGSASTDPNGNNTIVKFIWKITSNINPGPSLLEPDACTNTNPRICTFGGESDGTPNEPLSSSFADQFPDEQSLIVQLQVEDSLGVKSNISTAPVPIEIVDNLAPIADAGPSINTTPNFGVLFDGSGSHDQDGGTIIRFDWDFGDGGQSHNRSTPQANHAYAQGATGSVQNYTVQLHIWDNANLYALCSVDPTPPCCDPFLTPPCPGAKDAFDTTSVRVTNP